jgi:hypothetical protein
MTTTCQVCGRTIRAATGTIAHHGYRRPGQGWQTASCMGARHVPYEVGHDALDAWIARLQEWIPERKLRLANWLAAPPARLEIVKRTPYGGLVKGYPRTVQRPEGFDPRTTYSCTPNTYANEYARVLSGHETAIRQITEALAYATARRAAWVAP